MPLSHHLKDAGPPAGPGRQIVSDITYIPTGEGWLYLATVMDLHSRRILGWKLANPLHATSSPGPSRHPCAPVCRGKEPSSTPDRGSQYTATATRALLARHGILQSMSAKGRLLRQRLRREPLRHPQERAHAHGAPFDTKALAGIAIFDYIETFYNRTRLHSALGYMSPDAFLKHTLQTRQTQLTKPRNPIPCCPLFRGKSSSSRPQCQCLL